MDKERVIAWVIVIGYVVLSYLCCHGSCMSVHYLTPDNDNAPCLGEPCFTLNEYIRQDTVQPFSSNTTVVFQLGQHYLNASEHIVIRDIRNLRIIGVEPPDVIGNSAVSGSEIVCVERSGFYFLNVSDLTIANVTVSLCGVSLPQKLIEESLSIHTKTFLEFSAPEQAAVVLFNTYDLYVHGLVVQSSFGYGLLAFNILGNSTIENSIFFLNNNYTLDLHICQSASPSLNDLLLCAGGNIVIVFVDTPECSNLMPTYNLMIAYCYTGFGVNALGFLGSGLTMALAQTSFGVHIDIDGLTSVGNTAGLGANIGILVYEVVDDSTISIRNSLSKNGNPFIQPTILGGFANSFEHRGSGLYFRYGLPLPTNFTTTCLVRDKHESKILTISKSKFIGNNAAFGGGARIRFTSAMPTNVVYRIQVDHCDFIENVANSASALSVQEVARLHNSVTVQFVFNNCSFTNNVCPRLLLPTSLLQFETGLLSTIQITSVQDVTFANCRFQDNKGTAVDAYSTRLRFYGNVTIARNFAVRGGGLGLHGDSLLLLPPSTHLSLLSNRAEFKGGAVYVVGSDYLRSPCFFQIELSNLTEILGIPITVSSLIPNENKVNIPTELDIVVELENNTAKSAGSEVYGGTVDNCIFLTTIYLSGYQDSGLLFDQLFNFKGNSTADESLISSDALHVCFCHDNVPDCKDHIHNITVYPGQTFEIAALTKGQRGGASPAVVHVNFLLEDEKQLPPVIGPFQSTQEVGRTCTPLSYTISSEETSLLMLLSIEGEISEEGSEFIPVNLLPCPPGFVLVGSPPSCDCNSDLTSLGLTCDIESQTIHRSSPYWISKEDSKHGESEIVVHQYCPLDYCTEKDVEVDVSNPDTQCVNHRTGILCGGCKPGLSTVFGSSKCQKCSNDYIALILPFLLLGIALILLLCTCESLHTTVGAINGLIFYANIVQFNRRIYFPQGETNILTVFVAWLNLDFGIPTCFYDGMDSYANTWLQLLFPAYIWALSGAIIVASHYSTTVSKFIGNYAIPVLSTLFLLSLAKFLRTIIVAMSFTFIEHNDGSQTTVWLYDGNLEYFEGKRVPLFLVALAISLFLVLPYIFLILLGPCLQKRSSHKGFRWVNKLKPFLDAYQGPYNEEFRYWTGLLLLVRGALFLVFSFNITNPGVILLVILITSQLLTAMAWYHGGVYKSWPMNALEAFFLINLGALTAGTFYAYYEKGNQAVVAYLSVSASLVVFLGIVFCGTYSKLARFLNLPVAWELLSTIKARVYHPRGTTAPQTISNQSQTEGHNNANVTSEFDFFPTRHDSNQLGRSFTVQLREPLNLITDPTTTT